MATKYNLHFYNKLFESNPIFNQNSNVFQKKHSSFFYYFYKKIFNISISIISIFRCFFLKKGKILFFNHTQRTRKNDIQFKTPLYLNEAIFNSDFFYYIETNKDKLNLYHAPKSILDVAKINELISLIIIFSKLIRKLKKKSFLPKEFYFYSQVKFWFIILKILKPKKIMFVVWYAYQPVIIAAKKIGIPTIDLQHGIVYESHPFYHLKDLNIDTSKKDTLPDQCWVYGDYWKGQLLKAGWNEEKIKVFGYYLNVPQKENLIDATPYILYTTSCSENKKEVVSHINSIINEVKTRGLKIIISPHPHEDPNNYKDILSDVVSLSKKDSYELLKNCEVHISAFSTLLWEGIYFKKSTYIMSYEKYKSHFNILSDLINKKLARTILSGQFPEVFNVEKNLNFQEYFSKKISVHLLNS